MPPEPPPKFPPVPPRRPTPPSNPGSGAPGPSRPPPSSTPPSGVPRRPDPLGRPFRPGVPPTAGPSAPLRTGAAGKPGGPVGGVAPGPGAGGSGAGRDEGPRTVTKKELVARISDALGTTKVAVRDALQMFLDEIIRELGRGNRIEFREFGVFEIKERGARRAHNPRTLEEVDVPSKRVVRFRVGRLMKDRVAQIPADLRFLADSPRRPGLDDEDDDD